MSALLEAHDVSKRFGGVDALSGVSFALAAGEIRALCGENGAGKSTLVKILTGVYRADRGVVKVGGEERIIAHPRDAQALGIAFVSQELSIAPHLSVNDNIWLGYQDVPLFHRRRALRRRAQAALEMIGLGHVALDRAASSLSLGERQLVEIARMLTRDARILILDEPTATLSDVEIERVFAALRRLRADGRAIVFITHRLAEVFEICDSVTVLRNGREVGSAATAAVDRARLIELMLGRPLDAMYPPAAPAADRVTLSVRHLRVPGAVRDLSFDVPQGRILCLAGQIGSGATDAVRALAGLVHEADGTVVLDGAPIALGSVGEAVRKNIRFVSEDRAAEGVFLHLPVQSNLVAAELPSIAPLGFLSRSRVRGLAHGLAKMVQLDPGRLPSLAGELSGGNQQKVAVAKSLGRVEPGVLLMNEPTRGVDVGARAEIYALMRRLCHMGYAIVMASTDIEEVVGMSDRIVTMYRSQKIREYDRAAISRAQILSDIIHPQHGADAA